MRSLVLAMLTIETYRTCRESILVYISCGRFMNWHFLIKGMVIGLAIAAPVGPIGVLCMQRSLTLGWLAGLVSGLGAASADAIYGAIAGFGLTAVAQLLTDQQMWLRLWGGMFLIYLGAKIFLTPVVVAAHPVGSVGGLLANYVSTFGLTLANPMTIISFGVVFAGLGAIEGARSFALVAGVFLGSTLWWFVLASGMHWLSHNCPKFDQDFLPWVNRGAGTIIVTLAVAVILSTFGYVDSPIAQLLDHFREVTL